MTNLDQTTQKTYLHQNPDVALPSVEYNFKIDDDVEDWTDSIISDEKRYALRGTP